MHNRTHTALSTASSCHTQPGSVKSENQQSNKLHHPQQQVLSQPTGHSAVQLRSFRARPRMVARSSVNSKRLTGNNSLSPVSSQSDSPKLSPSTMPRPNKYPAHPRGGGGGQVLGFRPSSTSGATDRSSSGGQLQGYTCSMYPDNLGTSMDDSSHLLNIDDLLLRRNRAPSKISTRDRNSRDTQYRTPPSTIPTTPIIAYQENAIQSDMDLVRLKDDKKSEDELSQMKHLEPVRHPPARVELMLIFVKIGQVDTVNERYQADIFLQARWREPLLDATWNTSRPRNNFRTFNMVENPVMELAPKRHLHTLKLQDDEFWNPRLLLDNAQGEPIEIVSHEVEFVEPDFEAYLVEKRRIKGIFHETLELKHFPFDCQDLSVTVTCDRTVEEVELVPSPTEVSQVDRRCAADSQEWKIFHHVDIASMEIQTAYSPGTCKRRHPGLVFTSRSARRAGYFMVNMALISCVLSLLSFSVFSVPVDGNRLQLSLLLLLTTVTFKFAASQNLPKISYLTYLDKMVLANFFMLVILTVWHTIARSVFAKYPGLKDKEQYVVYTLLSAYCLGAVVFGLTVYLDAGSRRRLMKSKDMDFTQHKQRIELAKQHKSIVAVSLDEWLNSPSAQSAAHQNSEHIS
ncbi:hypothetical protein T265_08254 [Opisthorchis viverrini]|uniref:Neurotransmitter-gated ion-channel ligand-binding domain-containing protein n=1 Tax=Opisthorchis viverrini TaxID=6198 RepID=A0A075A8W6_OPIVI|nr:hypothetical protein T265_08254 [Opisthorchis viverrini]KER23954.1 hypothetical protein T265_08254 [Opisthorchis viverrini]